MAARLAHRGREPPPDFDALLRQSESLTAHIPRQDGVPLLRSNAPEIEAGSRRMAASAAAAAVAAGGFEDGVGYAAAERNAQRVEERGQRLLSQHNFDSVRLDRDMAAMELRAAHEPTRPLGVTDIDGYLAHHHDMILVTATEEARRAAENAALLRHREWEVEDWRRAKQRLLAEMGMASGTWQPATIAAAYSHESDAAADDRGFSNLLEAAPGATTPSKTPARGVPGLLALRGGTGTPFTPSAPRSALTAAERAHAEVIARLNRAEADAELERRGGGSGSGYGPGGFPVAAQFAEVAAALMPRGAAGGPAYRYARTWRLLRNILEPRDGGRVEALADPAAAAAGARAFLEGEYLELVRARVADAERRGLLRQPPGRSAARGVEATVRAHVEMLANDNRLRAALATEKYQGLPLWAQVFFALRCGAGATAASILCGAAAAGSREAAAENVASLLVGDGTAVDLTAADAEYSKLSDGAAVAGPEMGPDGGADPYKKAVLEIARGLGPRKVSEMVSGTIEDYMWFRLSFVGRHADTGSGGSGSGGSGSDVLGELQGSIQRWGPGHFVGEDGSPFAYADVLLLCQLFRPAVQFLRGRGHVLEALHLAIAIDYHDALAATSAPDFHARAGGRAGGAGQPATPPALEEEDAADDGLGLLRGLVLGYVRRIWRSDPVVALDYLLRLRRQRGGSGGYGAAAGDTFSKAVLEMLRETRSFGVLAGGVGKDGRRQLTGALDPHLPPREVADLLGKAADAAEARGSVMDAMELFVLGEHYGEAIRLLVGQLAAALAPGIESRRQCREAAEAFAAQFLTRPRPPRVEDELADPGVAQCATEFERLLQLAQFCDLADAERDVEALAALQANRLLPATEDEARREADKYPGTNLALRRSYDKILLRAMRCLSRRHASLKRQWERSGGGGGLRSAAEAMEGELELLRRRAGAIISFCAMARDVVARGELAQLTSAYNQMV